MLCEDKSLIFFCGVVWCDSNVGLENFLLQKKITAKYFSASLNFDAVLHHNSSINFDCFCHHFRFLFFFLSPRAQICRNVLKSHFTLTIKIRNQKTRRIFTMKNLHKLIFRLNAEHFFSSFSCCFWSLWKSSI